MKKPLSLMMILLGMIACGPGGKLIERTMEDGVEVVLSHAIPYRAGQDGLFSLEEIFRIDSETETRIGDILGFEVNAAGDIFILRQNIGEGDFLFKFDGTGRFLKSFARKGQGPGELQNPHHLAIGKNDRLVISDLGRVFEYDVEGTFLRAYPLDFAARVTAGPGGTWMAQNVEQQFRGDIQTMTWSANLLDSRFVKLRGLDSMTAEISLSDLRFPEPLLCWSASKDRVFVGNENRGYDIHVYDEGGTLKRRIKKEYAAVPVSDEFKARALKPMPEPMRKAVNFPLSHTPFRSLAAADDGKLFVATFEAGARPGESIFDIFAGDGGLMGRKSLPAVVWEGHLWAKIQSGKLYSLSEKPNGFKEIISSRILWK
jgi:hypothetical protein